MQHRVGVPRVGDRDQVPAVGGDRDQASSVAAQACPASGGSSSNSRSEISRTRSCSAPSANSTVHLEQAVCGGAPSAPDQRNQVPPLRPVHVSPRLAGRVIRPRPYRARRSRATVTSPARRGPRSGAAAPPCAGPRAWPAPPGTRSWSRRPTGCARSGCHTRSSRPRRARDRRADRVPAGTAEQPAEDGRAVPARTHSHTTSRPGRSGRRAHRRRAARTPAARVARHVARAAGANLVIRYAHALVTSSFGSVHARK